MFSWFLDLRLRSISLTPASTMPGGANLADLDEADNPRSVESSVLGCSRAFQKSATHRPPRTKRIEILSLLEVLIFKSRIMNMARKIMRKSTPELTDSAPVRKGRGAVVTHEPGRVGFHPLAMGWQPKSATNTTAMVNKMWTTAIL